MGDDDKWRKLEWNVEASTFSGNAEISARIEEPDDRLFAIFLLGAEAAENRGALNYSVKAAS